jgi:hypothetical protein
LNTPKKVLHSIKNLVNKKKMPPDGTDLVGYEGLTEYIDTNGLLTIEGDMLEIGTFLGGGAYKLSKFIEKKHSTKKLYVIDPFDPTLDITTNTDGNAMNTLYVNTINGYKGKTQLEIFSEITGNCKNIVILKCDSKNANIPCEKLSFAFIDGNHSPEYVENDFYLVWNKLAPGGVVAFHDYKFDLPQTTNKIDDLIKKNSKLILETYYDTNRHVIYIRKTTLKSIQVENSFMNA